MTNQELLAMIEGYLCANADRGLTPEQVKELVELVRKRTAEYVPNPWRPYYSPVSNPEQEFGITTCEPSSIPTRTYRVVDGELYRVLPGIPPGFSTQSLGPEFERVLRDNPEDLYIS